MHKESVREELTMYYKDIIKPDKISAYQNLHKIIYRALSSMIFDLCFVENGYAMSQTYKNTRPDEISRSLIFRDMFSVLILKTYKAFFDNSGIDSTNLLKFKNKIIGTFVKDEYRYSILTEISNCRISDNSYKSKLESIKTNTFKLRDTVLAHNLNVPSGSDSVYLPDIRELLENGCELFQALSFRPLDFYSWIEGDGYDFSREFTYTKELTRRVWEYFYLSSDYIQKIDGDIYVEYFTVPEESQKELSVLIESINKGKEKDRIDAEARFKKRFENGT